MHGKLKHTVQISQANFQPLYDRLLVRRIETPAVTAGGILLPETSRERPAEGVVVATGPGKPMKDGSTQRMTVQVGDRIIFGKRTWIDASFDDPDLVMMNEADVYGILDADTPLERHATVRSGHDDDVTI